LKYPKSELANGETELGEIWIIAELQHCRIAAEKLENI
jgi:hypothetical protein